MEIYRHSVGREDPELIEVDEASLVKDLVGEDGGLVWMEEQEAPLDPEGTLAAVGVRSRTHVHHGRCTAVETSVRFNGDRKAKTFPPATTIRRVFEWAVGREGFNLPPEQRAKHVLALPDADHFLDWHVHIGSLVTAGSCAVTLDLLPRERFEG